MQPDGSVNKNVFGTQICVPDTFFVMFPLFIKFRVKGVEVSGIEIILGYAECFTEPYKRKH